MLRSTKAMFGFGILARDGETGKIADILFDDAAWGVRYLVVEAGSWLAGRQVLIAPEALEEPEWESKRVPVKLTNEQVRHSPPVTAGEPFSRRQAVALHSHYGWAVPTWFAGDFHLATPPRGEAAEESAEEEKSDLHLRSSREVLEYRLQAMDGEIGHLEDFLLDDQHWQIRYLVADTRNWWPGKKVLLAPAEIHRIGWGEKKVLVGRSRQEIRNSPEYDPDAPLGREYEVRLHEYYGWPKYWV